MNKDWTGDGNSIFKMLGASNHTDKERETHDFYATSPEAIDLLKKKIDLPKQILEPACGSGCLSERLIELGHEVRSYDLIDRGYGEVQDFFKMTEPPFEGDFAIVTNPPYKCYDSDTQCYTKRGWLKYDEIKQDDMVLSVNPITQELEWAEINEIIVRDLLPDERMYHFHKSHLDIMVTSGHRMFCFDRSTNNLVTKNGDLVKSEDIISRYYIPRSGYKWRGKETKFFILPAINGKRYAQPCYKDAIKIPMDDWLDFFGLWLADGYCRHTLNSQGNYRKTIGIKQAATNGDRIREALDKLPFVYKEKIDNYGRKNDCINFEINNEQLWSYLLQFGKSYEKYVPDEIKGLSSRQLKLFIDAYHDGDGSSEEKGAVIYRTTSKRLICDVQEVLLKLGYLSHVTLSKYITDNGTERTVYLIRTSTNGSIFDRMFFPANKSGQCAVNYDGVVWCLNLKKNGVFLLRRNGKEFFCGNCATDFVLHSLELIPNGSLVCMFLKTTFLESKGRYEKIFRNSPPVRVLQCIERVLCAKNADFDYMRKHGGSAVAYCWAIWRKGDYNQTTLDWI